MVEADGGYQGEHLKIKTPSSLHVMTKEDKRMKQLVRSRHETVNSRVKIFAIMGERFRHPDLVDHSSAFRAVAVVTQLTIEDGHPLFGVDYTD